MRHTYLFIDNTLKYSDKTTDCITWLSYAYEGNLY